MNLLFTGSSGFLGQSIIPFLISQFNIQTLGIGSNEEYNLDLSKQSPMFKNAFDVVLHAAGKAHSTPVNLNEKRQFYAVNLEGTKNLCKSLEFLPPKAFIFISTVAVYGLEAGENIKESNPLNGSSPYALSKIEAEAYLMEWCKSHNVKLSIIRPSLIAGKNPPGNLGALINGIESGKYFRIGNGAARKSVLIAEDVARVLPALIEKGGTYNLCDNHHPSFAELEELVAGQLGKKTPRSIPYWVAKKLALAGDVLGKRFPLDSNKLHKIVKPLTFSNEKAKRTLNWEPLDVLQHFKIN